MGGEGSKGKAHIGEHIKDLSHLLPDGASSEARGHLNDLVKERGMTSTKATEIMKTIKENFDKSRLKEISENVSEGTESLTKFMTDKKAVDSLIKFRDNVKGADDVSSVQKQLTTLLKDTDFNEGWKNLNKSQDQTQIKGANESISKVFRGILGNAMDALGDSATPAQKANYKAASEKLAAQMDKLTENLNNWKEGRGTLHDQLNKDNALDDVIKTSDELGETLKTHKAYDELIAKLGDSKWAAFKRWFKRIGYLVALGLIGLILYGVFYDLMFTRCRYNGKGKNHPLIVDKNKDETPYMKDHGAYCNCADDKVHKTTDCAALAYAGNFPFCMKPNPKAEDNFGITDSNKFCTGTVASSDDDYVGYTYYDCSFPKGILNIPSDFAAAAKSVFDTVTDPSDFLSNIGKYIKYAIYIFILFFALKYIVPLLSSRHHREYY